MEGGEKQGGGKRISFLMPYIDFCFMLIIIFVGMLSIAYFDPVGAEKYEIKRDKVIDGREGNFEPKPSGVQAPKFGAGEENQDSVKVSPMITRIGDRGAGAAAGAVPGAVPAARGDAGELERLKKELAARQKELERLKNVEAELHEKEKELERLREIQDRLAELQAELEKLKQQRKAGETDTAGIGVPGKGNHVYMDLRGKGNGG